MTHRWMETDARPDPRISIDLDPGGRATHRASRWCFEACEYAYRCGVWVCRDRSRIGRECSYVVHDACVRWSCVVYLSYASCVRESACVRVLPRSVGRGRGIGAAGIDDDDDWSVGRFDSTTRRDGEDESVGCVRSSVVVSQCSRSRECSRVARAEEAVRGGGRRHVAQTGAVATGVCV